MLAWRLTAVVLTLAGTLSMPPQRTLAPCPDSPNCVSTEATRESQRMPTVPFSDTPAQALVRARAAVLAESRTEIVSEEDGWIKAESKSLIFRFTDDVDVLVDNNARVFRFRSASRLGKSDLGVNRKRMTRISERLRSAADTSASR